MCWQTAKEATLAVCVGKDTTPLMHLAFAQQALPSQKRAEGLYEESWFMLFPCFVLTLSFRKVATSLKHGKAMWEAARKAILA